MCSPRGATVTVGPMVTCGRITGSTPHHQNVVCLDPRPWSPDLDEPRDEESA